MMKKLTPFYIILLLTMFLATFASQAQSCNCSYTVPLTEEIVDNAKLKLPAGSTICIQAGQRTSLWFDNFVGTPEKPFLFVNCGGQVVVSNTTKWGISFSHSKHFKLLGNGHANYKYGIKVNGVATVGLSFNRLSTDFEAAYIEVYKSLGPALMVKTDPECGNSSTWKGNFTMRNVNIHHFYVHEVGSVGGGGEGFYIGSSFWNGWQSPTCGILYPHTIENIKVHDNIIESTVFDGMQVSCAVSGVEVYNNTIRNFGTINNGGQQQAMVVGGGTKGRFFNNKIDKGTGMGICVFGQGDVFVYNNLISNTTLDGIFIDDRTTDPTLGFHIYNNTVINAKLNGITMYSALSTGNTFYNNLIVNPGNWPKFYDYKRAFIYLENIPGKVVKFDTANNYFAKDLIAARFVDPTSLNFHLLAGSPAINRGRDLTAKGVTFDLDNLKRPTGGAFDIGAYEYGASTPLPSTTLAVSTTSSTPLCYNASNGKVTATAVGGTAPYTYLWSNGKTTQSLDQVPAGTYSVSVTDSKGAKVTKSITLGQPAAISITSAKIDATATTKGSINVTVTGGTAPYVYSWSNNATTEDINNVAAGTYTVTVKDGNGCRKIATIIVGVSTGTPSSTPSSSTTGFSGVYSIVSKQTGKLMEIAGSATTDNAPVTIKGAANTTNQKWKIEPIAGGYYKITASHSGKVLEATSSADGAAIVQKTASTSDCQKWQLVPVGNGYYKIVAKCSGRGLEVKGGSTANGASVAQWTYWGGDYQKWEIKLVSAGKRAGVTEENILEETVRAFPNPVIGGKVNLSILSQKVEDATIDLVNSATGEQHTSLSKRLTVGENTFEIPTTNLNDGIHFIIIQTSTSKITKKIVVSK